MQREHLPLEVGDVFTNPWCSSFEGGHQSQLLSSFHIEAQGLRNLVYFVLSQWGDTSFRSLWSNGVIDARMARKACFLHKFVERPADSVTVPEKQDAELVERAGQLHPASLATYLLTSSGPFICSELGNAMTNFTARGIDLGASDGMAKGWIM